MTQPIVLLLRMIFDLVIIFLLMRFSLQLARADFYNPVSQAIVRLTNPMLAPLRRFIPPLKGQDSASLLLAFAFALIFLIVAYSVTGGIANPFLLPLLAVLHLLEIALDMLFWGVIIHAILSWFPNAQGAPAARVLDQLISPLLAPIRRLIPDLGGIDLSPLALLLLVQIIKISVLPILVSLLV
ncbi:MAG: YggT family protein [Pseudomonadota bacterium]